MNTPTVKSTPAEAEKGAMSQIGVHRLVRRYFGREVIVTKEFDDWHPCPWMFTINDNGTVHRFAGLPNKCETSESAFKRAWWRCKWMAEGTYGDRYKPVSTNMEVSQPRGRRSKEDGPRE